jgi:hypothetical protein
VASDARAKFMPKRGIDADSRIFFDELSTLGVSRLRATGAIKLEDRQAVIPFGGRMKLISLAHTVFKNGGSWSYFRCPKCGGRAKKLWLVDDAPRCVAGDRLSDAGDRANPVTDEIAEHDRDRPTLGRDLRDFRSNSRAGRRARLRRGRQCGQLCDCGEQLASIADGRDANLP